MLYLIIAVLVVVILVLIILLLKTRKKQPEKSAEFIEERVAEEAVPAAADVPEEPVVASEKLEQQEMPEAEEEFVELSLDAEEEVEEEIVELSLDMEEKEPVEQADDLAVAEAEMPDAADVAPALAGAAEESDIVDEEAPEELTEKLDYYFGGEEEAAGEIPEPEGEEEEIVLEEPVAEPAEVPEFQEEAVRGEVPEGLDSEGFTDRLRSIESGLRRELKEDSSKEDIERRGILEAKLLAVCEKLASMEDVLSRQQELTGSAQEIIEQLDDESRRSELPGIAKNEAIRELLAGNYEQVEKILGDGILQLDQESGLVPRVYYLCGLLAEERLDYESAFEDYRNALGVDPENEAYILAAGRVAGKLGNDQDGKAWLEKLVRNGIETDEQTLSQAAAQYELALLCVREGQKEKAGALFKRALEIREKLQGAEHPDLGPVKHDYARLYESNGMYEQAEQLYTSALDILENKLGPSHPGLASTLNRLAGLYEELELEEKSLPLYERALAIKEQVLGRDHHDVGVILNSLADLLRRNGRLEEAEPMLRRSLEIAENELGEDHPNLTVVLNNLAELYSEMGREEEAARYQERAFSLFELPGMDGDFVEMKKDDVDIDDDKDETIAGK